MKLSITYLELHSPFHFFELSSKVLKIMKQLKNTSCNTYKTSGFWKKHYTMTLWEDAQEMKEFARSGAHLEAMKASSKIAKEIKVVTIDGDQLISWKEAKEIIRKAKKSNY